MNHSVTLLVGGRPIRERLQDQRPFENYTDQPDTEARKRLELQAIPFALPEKRDE